MSKRNFTLLIIFLILVIVVVFGWLYFRTPADTTDNGGGDTNFLSRFNPFASSPSPTPTPNGTTTDNGDNSTPVDNALVKLNKVSSMPIAGYTVFQKERYKDMPVIVPTTGTPASDTTVLPAPTPAPVTTKTKVATVKPTPPPTEFVPALRYVDKATGNIYQTFADKIDERQFSTTVIPKVYEAYFGNSGTSVLMRYLKTDDKTIQTFVGTLPKELLGGDTTGDNAVTGSFLPDNTTDVSLSADASKIFYLFNMGDGNQTAVGTTLDLLTNKKIQVFDNAFTEWLSWWPNSKIITFTTKPSAQVAGYMYTLDLATKNFGKTFGGINGLTTMTSPSGNLVLYADNTLSLSVYNTITKSSIPMGLKTLPDKCVWGSASDTIYCAVPTYASGTEYPDLWYKGEISFTDNIWQIDPVSGISKMIMNPSAEVGGEAIDGIKLMLDQGENYLFFVNKKDSYLWKLDLN